MAILFDSLKSKHNPKVSFFFFINKARVPTWSFTSFCNNSSHQISNSMNSVWPYDKGFEDGLSTNILVNLNINVYLGVNSLDSFLDVKIHKLQI